MSQKIHKTGLLNVNSIIHILGPRRSMHRALKICIYIMGPVNAYTRLYEMYLHVIGAKNA
jgi:hypothetical protein